MNHHRSGVRSRARRASSRLAGLAVVLCASSGLAVAAPAAATARPGLSTSSAGPPLSASAASAPRHVRASQDLAGLLFEHHAYRSPHAGAPVVAVLPARTPITREQTTLPVVGRRAGSGTTRWLKVMLPGRPNGSSGWIAQGGTVAEVTGWHLMVDKGSRRVTAYFDGRLQRAFAAVVGKPSTPTPSGNFFVQESIAMPSTAAGGPFALALSARSDALQTFEGGPGQIAIHGRDLLGGTLGQAESHGCVRLDTASISWLVTRIGPGVPVTIYG